MKLINNRAWPNFKHLITEDKILKYKNIEDLKKHIQYSGNPDILQYEFDGTSLTLYYENGELIHAVTQGSDGIGEDILENALNIKSIPKSINIKESIIVKGVLTISKDNFAKLKSEGNSYANIRYAVAGIARRLDKFNIKYLDFIAIKIYNKDFSGLDILENNNFIYSKNLLNSNIYTNDLLENFISNKIDNKYSIVGITAKNNNYNLSYRFSTEYKETKVVKYDWSLSNNNKLIPMIYFDPVEIDGSIISKASLLCAGVYKNLDAPIGSTILVTKADGILPHVEKVILKSDNSLEIPETCPNCGGKLSWYKNHLICKNSDCGNILFSRCLKFLKSLKVLRFNDVIIQGLIDNGSLREFTDLFKLVPENFIGIKTSKRGVITNKAAINILATLNEKLKSIDDKTFIASLNLYKITTYIAKAIEKEALKQNSTLLEAFEQCNISILEKAIKPTKIKTIMDYMNNHKEEYYELKNILLGI